MLRKFALLGVIGATLTSTAPAMAQLYGDPFGGLRPGAGRQGPPPDRYDRGYDRGYERGPRGYYDDGPRRRGGGRFGDYCTTGRGACQTAPQPVGTSCRCNIDGLTKRGIIQ
jgi:hypothetical protein